MTDLKKAVKELERILEPTDIVSSIGVEVIEASYQLQVIGSNRNNGYVTVDLGKGEKEAIKALRCPGLAGRIVEQMVQYTSSSERHKPSIPYEGPETRFTSNEADPHSGFNDVELDIDRLNEKLPEGLEVKVMELNLPGIESVVQAGLIPNISSKQYVLFSGGIGTHMNIEGKDVSILNRLDSEGIEYIFNSIDVNVPVCRINSEILRLLDKNLAHINHYGMLEVDYYEVSLDDSTPIPVSKAYAILSGEDVEELGICLTTFKKNISYWLGTPEICEKFYELWKQRLNNEKVDIRTPMNLKRVLPLLSDVYFNVESKEIASVSMGYRGSISLTLKTGHSVEVYIPVLPGMGEVVYRLFIEYVLGWK